VHQGYVPFLFYLKNSFQVLSGYASGLELGLIGNMIGSLS
jgi:hypothetical protein